MKSYQAQVETKSFDDPTAAKLAEFIKSKQSEITHIIERAQQLASVLQSKSLELGHLPRRPSWRQHIDQ